MSRTQQHKDLKEKKRQLLVQVFDFTLGAVDTFSEWLLTHSAISEQDREDVDKILQGLFTCVTDIAKLYRKCYGRYTNEMVYILDIAGEELQDKE